MTVRVTKIPNELDSITIFLQWYPEKYVEQGDPYQHQIQTSVDQLKIKLGRRVPTSLSK